MKYVVLSYQSGAMKISSPFGTELPVTLQLLLAYGELPSHTDDGNGEMSPHNRDTMTRVMSLPKNTVLEYKTHNTSLK